MSAIATTVNKVEPSGSRTRATGTLTLDASYDAGGDTVDPLALGLATVEDLFLGLPRSADGGAIAAIFFPVVRSVLPQRTTAFGGGGLIYIQAFTDNNSEASGDLSGYVIPYEAYGV